jgi:hypothetical protein
VAQPVAFQQELEQHVEADLAAPIDSVVDEMARVVGERAQLQAKAVVSYLGARPKKFDGVMIGVPDNHFKDIRHEMLAQVRGGVLTALSRDKDILDAKKLGRSLGDAAQQSMQLTAAAGMMSASTLGGLAAAHCLDATGILAASSIALTGLLVLPARRKRARAEIDGRFTALRGRLDAAVEQHVKTHMEMAAARIMDNIAPYTRFVKIEKRKLTDLQTEIGHIRVRIHDLKQRVTGGGD